MNWGATLLVLALGGALAYALGRGLMAAVRAENAGPAAAAVALAAGAIGLGVVGAMTARAAWISYLACGAVAMGVVRELARKRSLPGSLAPADPGRAAGRLALAILGVQLGAMAFAALAPPTSIDALEYHLEAPRRFWREGGLAAIPGSPESMQPLNIQLLYGLLLPISDRLPGLLHVGMGAALAVVIADLACRFTSTRAAVAGALAAVATPMVAWEGPGAFVDLGVALLAACSLSTIDRWRREGGGGRLALAGVFAGLAAGSKGTGPAIIAGLAAAVLVAARVRRARTGTAATFATLALLVASPWYLRALVQTGDPFYPLFSSDPAMVAYRASLGSYGHGRDLLHLAAAPVQLILQGAPFDGGHYLGVAALALAPAALLSGHMRAAAPCLTFGAVFFGAWLGVGSLQARLLLPLAAPAGVVAALGFGALAERGRALAACAYLPVALSAAAGAGAALVAARQAAPVVLGREPRAEWLARSTLGYQDYAHMNQALAPTDHVLLFARGAYYLDVPYDRCARPVCSRLSDLDPAVARASGFTHVYWTGEAPPWLSAPGVRLIRRATLRYPTRRALGTFATTSSWLAALEQP